MGRSRNDEKTLSLWDEDVEQVVSLTNIKTLKQYTIKIRNQLVIGRNPDYCNLTLSDDQYISGRHVCFTEDGGQIYLEDLRSKNGTRLNGNYISGKVRIKTGDVLRIGRTELEIQIH